MAWEEYKYYAEAWKDSMVYRPVIGLDFLDGKDWIKSTAMIDSGCDRTLVNAEFADALGIKDRSIKEKIGGVCGAPSEGFRGRITVRVEKFENYTFELDVIFVPDMKFPVLLGHGDFFEKFKIRFEKKKRRFYLSKESNK